MGSSGFTVSGNHTYAQAGAYTTTVTIDDQDGASALATSAATATALATALTALSIQSVATQTFSGSVGTFQDAALGDPASTFTATIAWGDGTTSAGTIVGGNGSFSVTGQHIYSSYGTFTTQITVADASGANTTTAQSMATISLPLQERRIIVAGADAGGGPAVSVFDAATGTLRFSFFAFDPGFTGGVRVAVGDVDGSGVPDIIVGAGPGGGPNIRVFNGITGQQLPGPLGNFFAFSPQFTGGVYVASGDVNDDGYSDIIVGAGAGGGPNVTVFSGKDGSMLYSLFPYPVGFSGGVRVGAADVDGDGHADILAAPGPGGSANVVVVSGATGGVLLNITAFASFSGGLYVSGADLYGTGRADVVVSKGPGSSPDVAVFDGMSGSLLSTFSAYNPLFTGGAQVAALDASGGNNGELIVAPGAGGGPDVEVRDGVTAALLDQFFAFSPFFLGGVQIAAGE
jgi:hypothetical protein